MNIIDLRATKIISGNLVLTILFILSTFFISLIVSGAEIKKKINLKDIKKVEGNIKLKLINSWGGDNETDDNHIFKIPTKIINDKNKNFYILDIGQNFIKCFTDNGHYIRNIGRRGEGPGEFLSPSSIVLDNLNNIHIFESGLKREFIYDINGNFKKKIRKNKSVSSSFFLLSGNRIDLERNFRKGISFTLTKRDKNNNFLNNIIKTSFVRKGGHTWDELFYTVDRNENIYVTLKATPIIRKFDKNGKFLYDIFYKTPYQTFHKIVKETKKNKLKLQISKSIMIVHGFTTDNNGNLFIIVKNKLMTPNMKKIYSLVMIGRGQTKKGFKFTDDLDTKGFFKLIVFNNKGELIASELLDVFCDQISISENNIYLLDTYYKTQIFKYKITFQTK